MTTRELAGDVLAWASARRDAMVDRVVELARIETPSSDPASQQPALALLTRWLEAVGHTVEIRPGRASGGCLVSRPTGADPKAPRQLLIGHVDTVWPVGTVRERPITLDGDVLRGPGVLDMKGGLVQLVTALEALAALGVRPAVVPEVVIATDEEVGSVDSQPVVSERAKGADRALVLEPAQGLDGRLKTRRKGSGRFSLVVEGRAAHAGLEPEKGISATVELAHQVLAAAALHDPARGVTVNVGTLEGGVGVNLVAPHARAMLDVRAWDVAEAERVTAALRALQPRLEGAKVRVEGRFGRLPMVPTPKKLWRAVEAAAASLGLTIRGAEVGGASDGNTASQHAPTVDGLGAIGEGAHAVTEHLRVDRMAERVALLALILAEPALG